MYPYCNVFKSSWEQIKEFMFFESRDSFTHCQFVCNSDSLFWFAGNLHLHQDRKSCQSGCIVFSSKPLQPLGPYKVIF